MAIFRLVDTQEFSWPVKPKQPNPKIPGKFETVTITCQFRMMPEKRAKEMQDEFAALTSEDERNEHRDDLLREVLIGWDEKQMGDESGQGVPFSPEALDMAISMPAFKLAAYDAYFDAITGGASRGN